MAKYKYRLEKVLNMRLKREDDLKLALADVQRIEQTEKALLDDLLTRQSNAQKGMDQQLSQGRTSEVQMSNDYLSSMKEKIEAQEKKAKAAREQVKAAEVTYKKAQRDSEVVKRHKEKSRERWTAEENRKEAIKLDEMSGQMYAARQKRNKESDEADAEYAEQRERESAELESALPPESAWIQGFMDTGAAEAKRIHAEWNPDLLER